MFHYKQTKQTQMRVIIVILTVKHVRYCIASQDSYPPLEDLSIHAVIYDVRGSNFKGHGTVDEFLA